VGCNGRQTTTTFTCIWYLGLEDVAIIGERNVIKKEAQKC
jgi:hypothetical protein